jgi:hypothetical protein
MLAVFPKAIHHRERRDRSKGESVKTGEFQINRGVDSMRFSFVVLASLPFIFFWPFSAIPQHQHGGMSMPGMPGMEGEKKGEVTIGNEASTNRTFLLDGVKASFSIMPMAEHKKMLKDMKMNLEVDPQATHNIAVTLTDTRTNLPIPDAVVKMKVIDPKGKAQIKLLDFTMAMNQYAGDFALSEKGRYQILILFKAGGKKQAAGFYYALR